MISIGLAVFVFSLMCIAMAFFYNAMITGSQDSFFASISFLMLVMIFGIIGSCLQSSGLI